MPPQIKQDINRSGWETTDMPSVCERCLPDNRYMQMLKEDYGAACSICTRPFTVFKWKTDRTSRQKKTGICLTCARMKNCCQHCMHDLSYGLALPVRDAALKMVAPGPQSEVNREYYAQNREKDIEEGRGLEGYSETDEKGRELLRRLAAQEPHYKRQRRLELEAAEEAEANGGQKLLEGGARASHATGAIRTADIKQRSAYGSPYSTANRGAVSSRGGAHAPSRRAFPSAAAVPIKAADIDPPADKNITSLFVTGVESDQPEHKIRKHFERYGQLRSLVCSHRSHCAFVNYVKREDAESAAAACQGRAVVGGVPLRVQWGKPKPLDNLEQSERVKNARAGRAVNGKPAGATAQGQKAIGAAGEGHGPDLNSLVTAPPPGQGEVQYPSMAGE